MSFTRPCSQQPWGVQEEQLSCSVCRHHRQHFPTAPLGPQDWTLSPGLFLGPLSLLNCTESSGQVHSHASAVQGLVKKNGDKSPWLLPRELPSWCRALEPEEDTGLTGEWGTSASSQPLWAAADRAGFGSCGLDPGRTLDLPASSRAERCYHRGTVPRPPVRA